MQGKEIKYKVRMQQFPIPAHKEVTPSEKQHEHYLIFLPWCIAYGFLFFMISLIKKVTEEKANGSKELLKMMGMTDGFYWCSTFADYFGVGAIMILIITTVYKSPLKCDHVYVSHSNFFLLLVLLLLFLVNLILFSMAFTTFFNRVIFAVIGIVVLFNVAFLPIALFCFPDNFDIPTYLQLPLDGRLAICLFPPGALLTIFHMVREYELI
ncbi:ATP-binding cassette sub-family A member 13-like, partial [Stegodyphus dumicola]|uniref:ATP-binding cassette sub-family A member 13-like n=1 Tax=Stegodyphus dumicola TaxID=202533 RepID=UPI0015AFE770